MNELEFTKNFIITYLSQDQTPDAIYDIYKIRSGNNKLLLEHITAIINIFTKAKEQLEGDKNE